MKNLLRFLIIAVLVMGAYSAFSTRSVTMVADILHPNTPDCPPALCR